MLVEKCITKVLRKFGGHNGHSCLGLVCHRKEKTRQLAERAAVESPEAVIGALSVGAEANTFFIKNHLDESAAIILAFTKVSLSKSEIATTPGLDGAK